MKKIKKGKAMQKHIDKLAKQYYKNCCDILSIYGALAAIQHGKSMDELARRHKVELDGLIKKIDEATANMMRHEW